MTQRIYRLSLLLFYLLQVTYKLKDKASNSYFLRVFKDEREASGGTTRYPSLKNHLPVDLQITSFLVADQSLVGGQLHAGKYLAIGTTHKISVCNGGQCPRRERG